MQALPVDPLKLAGQTAVVQVYALVMSVVPLRVYRHQERVAFVHPVNKVRADN